MYITITEPKNITLLSDIIIPILTIGISFLLAYFSVKLNIRNQYNKGKYQLFEIVNRYFLNIFNSVDITKNPPCTKTEKIDKIYQLEELKAIHQDILKLFDNFYLIDLFKKFPEVSMINIALRREIIDLGNVNQVTLKPDNIDLFYKLHSNIRKELPNKIFKKNKEHKKIIQLVEMINNSMNPHKTVEK